MKEMGMTSSHRRFILHSIQEWKVNPVRLICLCHYVCHHLQFPNACNPNPHQAELAFQTSECLAKKERSAALVASYEQAVKMGHAEAHAALSWLLMVRIHAFVVTVLYFTHFYIRD